MIKAILGLLKFLLISVLSLVILVVAYINFHPTFGAAPNAQSMAKIERSPNFDGEHFKNLVSTRAATIGVDNTQPKKDIDRWGLLKKFLFPPEGKNPSQPINSKALVPLKNGDFIWLGHSTVLFKTNDTTLITDPVFHNAAPVPFAVKPFAMTHTPRIEDLPFIDAVLISHDHYDHLDHRAIVQLRSKVGHFYVPLGVKAHLLRWGVPEHKVSEFDWYEQSRIKNIELVFTPSRHFSGRGVLNHRQTLWGSWVVLAPQLKAYFSGDGGYSPEFTKIGQKFGGFDIAFMEDGAYNKRWQGVHMLPEQSAQAAVDVRAKVLLPIHWGKFDLSTHQWLDPVKRITQAIAKYNATKPLSQHIQLATPQIGEVFRLEQPPQTPWWQD